MLDAQTLFRTNMRDADALSGLYDYLTKAVTAPMSFDDLLRSKLVYSVSAFDKLIHDLVCHGMVQIFLGKRLATDKYRNEPIPLSVMQQLATRATPPDPTDPTEVAFAAADRPELIFERTVRAKLKLLSFQDPEKVAEGLSYIWPEPRKWQRIATEIGWKDEDARKKLKLIAARRNAIVHEADMDPVTHAKQSISMAECDDIGKFLFDVGTAICKLVALSPAIPTGGSVSTPPTP